MRRVASALVLMSRVMFAGDCPDISAEGTTPARLDEVLDRWEASAGRCNSIRRLFRRYSYNHVFSTGTRGQGMLESVKGERILLSVRPIESGAETATGRVGYHLKDVEAWTWYADKAEFLKVDDADRSYLRLEFPSNSKPFGELNLSNPFMAKVVWKSLAAGDILESALKSCHRHLAMLASISCNDNIGAIREQFDWALAGASSETIHISGICHESAAVWHRLDVMLDPATFQVKAFQIADSSSQHSLVVVFESIECNDVACDVAQRPDLTDFERLEDVHMADVSRDSSD